MSVALTAQKPVTFEIKSANLSLVALLLKTSDIGRLSQEFKQRFNDLPDFFDNDPLLIDLHFLQAAEPAVQIDFPALLDLLRQHRLKPLVVRSGSPAQMAQALAGGLVCAPEVSGQRRVEPLASLAPSSMADAPLAAPTPQPAIPASALVIDKPLRSGQQVYARGRDLVLLSMVNPGAEVIADGHIHVYAPLRGKAMAGARGNTEARIFALSMAPELLSIAGIYRTSEVSLPQTVLGLAAQVRLQSGHEGDKLIVERLST
ncbi:septum site-determining protein MinC [Hydrogenophaga sp.]|uniref:septum site-determining protein MinC n=1 Tax=Hydrogenophaga sp. TaxID=1904254 RepID=UPI001984F16E|nr:septum site-determining protein MinC [Hydrogenophaga sp.]MBD3894109.1 septum site-determining protein MinC [Hydrogenophaga sp.]